MLTVELLAPARDADCGVAAFSCGADAVYIGGERWSAREKASNPLREVERLCAFGHRYGGRVYLALNTLLYDGELEAAVRLAERAREAGVDGFIVADLGLFARLRPRMSGLTWIASTQCHVADPGRALFLEGLGFDRLVLERHLTLEEIRAIRGRVRVGLEAFVHGSLCWAESGRCWLSFVMGGRSGLRGACAQPCRLRWRLVDASGRVLAPERHWLSLKDLDCSERLADLLDAGVTAFKIEGRMRGVEYVKNVVAHYRRRLDAVLAARGTPGRVRCDPGFEPDLSATFRRGGTEFRLDGGCGRVDWFAPDSPKSVGGSVGRVVRRRGRRLFLGPGGPVLRVGDGLCWVVSEGTEGGVVSAVGDGWVELDAERPPEVGDELFRNRDVVFLRRVRRAPSRRWVPVRFVVRTWADGWTEVRVGDLEGTEVVERLGPERTRVAERPQEGVWRGALSRCGGTPFGAEEVVFEGGAPRFVPVKELNALRRRMLSRLEEERERARREGLMVERGLPGKPVGWGGGVGPEVGVANGEAELVYRWGGVEGVERVYEAGRPLRSGDGVAVSRACFLKAMGCCGVDGGVFLEEASGRARFLVVPLCGRCAVELRRV